MSSIDASTTAIGGMIQLYKYEPFSNSFQLNSNAVQGSSLSFSRSSAELYQFLSTPDTSSVVFNSLIGPNTSYSASLRLIVDEVSSSVIYQSLSNSVQISPGRFTSPVSGVIYTFYKNEPISNTYADASVSFVGSIPINQPITTPSLPVGVSWQQSSSTTYRLTGTPTIQTGTSNYNIIGTDVCGGRTISTRANIGVNAERLLVDLSDSSTLSGLVVGTAIAPRGVTIRVPPYSSSAFGKIRYTWTPTLPDGFSFRDVNGNVFSNGGITPDPSSSIVLVGTPTSNALRTFNDASYQVVLTATRTFSPFLTGTVPFVFSATESILFDTPNIQSSFYTNAPISASALSNSFKARTQFAVGTDASIATIFSPNLRSDLSLVFLSNLQRADLSGTPTSAGSATYTIRAINGNGTSADLSTAIVVNNDSIVFDYSVTPTTDVCYSFIVGRQLSDPKIGYSDKSRRFKATAQSQSPVTMTATPLFGTGISLVSVGSNTYELSGTPFAAFPLQTLTVSAVSSVTGASGSTTTQYSIVPDRYTFTDVSSSLQFVQNFPITPIQFQATALSDLPVLNYYSANIPTGLTLSSSGRLTGTLLTDTSSSFTIFATTGFTTDSSSFAYSVRPDSMILFTPSNSYSYLAGADVAPIPVTGVTYSGTTVSNFQFSNLSPQYGLTLDASTGFLDGVLTDSIPPNDVLPVSSNFDVTAKANLLTGALSTTLSTSNAIVYRTFMARNASTAGIPQMTILAADSNVFTWQSNAVTLSPNGSTVLIYQVSDIQRKTTTLDNNVILAPAVFYNVPIVGSPQPARLYRSTTYGSIFVSSDVSEIDNISSVTNKPGTSTWWGIGAKVDVCSGTAVLIRSDNDGLRWSSASIVQVNSANAVFCRDGGASVSAQTTGNYYTTAGSVIRYKDGVLLAGGSGYSNTNNIAMLRSDDEALSWTQPTGSLCSNAAEVATISVAAPSRWVAAGSSRYSTYDPASTFAAGGFQDAVTLVRSDDLGQTWVDCTDGFNFSGYDVTYADRTWLATGVRATEDPVYYPELKYSTDGNTWSNVTQINSLFSASSNKLTPPIGIGPMMYDGTNWNVVVCREDPSGSNQFPTSIYTHPNVEPFETGWTAYTNVSGLSIANQKVPYVGMLPPIYTRTGAPITATLTFNTFAGSGPVITSPSETTLLFYQYMQITPVVFSAAGSGPIYFFLDTTTLPLGLRWNPLTQTISGAPVRTGTVNFTVYAKDSIGITIINLKTNTIIPRIIRKQDGAGAYTSLLRQYTLVNAAQNARDNRVFPSQERALGEFMAPQAPDVVTQSNCPC